MSKFAANDFRYDLPAVQVPVTIEAEGGDDDIGPIVVEPVDRPRIKTLVLTSQHPTDKEPQIHNFGGQDADLSFLRQTNLKLEFQSNVPIEEAKVNGAPAEVKQIADDRFTISWVHEKPVSMQIEMTSSQAKLTSLPTPVAIGLKVDQPPRVSLSFTGVRQRITPMAKIPLTILARDDYGVAQMDLASKAEFVDANQKPQTLTSTESIARPVQSRDRAGDSAEEGFRRDWVEAHAEHDPVVDGKRRGSMLPGATDRHVAPATFRIVAPEELFREILFASRASVPSSASRSTKPSKSRMRWRHSPHPKPGANSPGSIERSSAKYSASAPA